MKLIKTTNGYEFVGDYIQDYYKKSNNWRRNHNLPSRRIISLYGSKKKFNAAIHKLYRRHQFEIFAYVEEMLNGKEAIEIITKSLCDYFDTFVSYKDLDLGDACEFYIGESNNHDYEKYRIYL